MRQRDHGARLRQRSKCNGVVGALPITVNIHSLNVLSSDQVLILNNDLNNVSILDGNILLSVVGYNFCK